MKALMIMPKDGPLGKLKTKDEGDEDAEESEHSEDELDACEEVMEALKSDDKESACSALKNFIHLVTE